MLDNPAASVTDTSPATGPASLNPAFAGSIEIITGFSASGKSSISGARAKETGATLLLEDPYYKDIGRIAHAFVRAFSYKKYLGDNTRRSFGDALYEIVYRMGQEAIFADALKLALQGKKVVVDVCPGQPEHFRQLLMTMQRRAVAENLNLNIEWLTCSDEVRTRRIAQRGTLFDKTLMKQPGYLAAVARIESYMRANFGQFMKNNDADRVIAPGLKDGAEVKNNGLAGWAARNHVRVLRNFCATLTI